MDVSRAMPSKVNVGLVTANVLGIAVFLYWSSRWVWYLPAERERGLYAATGEPFLWAGIVVPIWGTFALIDLIWGVTIIAKRRWRNALLWLAVVCVWLVAVAIDFAHH